MPSCSPNVAPRNFVDLVNHQLSAKQLLPLPKDGTAVFMKTKVQKEKEAAAAAEKEKKEKEAAAAAAEKEKNEKAAAAAGPDSAAAAAPLEDLLAFVAEPAAAISDKNIDDFDVV